MSSAAPSLGGSSGTRVTSPLSDALVAQQDRLLACVHCGFCLPVCPTYTRLGDEADSPRGRLYLMRSVVEGRLEPAADAFQLHIDRCLGCRACETVCPSGVEYGALLEVARAEAANARPIPWPTRAMLRVFESGVLTGLVMALAMALRATRLPAFLARALPDWRRLRKLRLAAGMLAATTSWRRRSAGKKADEKEVPDGPPTTPPGYRAPRTIPMTAAEHNTGSSVAGVLEGCVQQGLFARVNAATGRTLEVNGLQVAAVPGQGCCGALHAHAGDIEAARELARRNVDAFTAAGVGVVVVNAAGCGAAMKEYGHLLGNDPDYAERARALAKRVRDVSEVLAERGPLVGASVPVVATYDAPCHLLHAQRVSRAPRGMLAAVPDLTLRPLEGEEECCGGAGIYGITHPELGGRIGADKADAVRRTGAELLVTGNPGCAMHIGAWLSMTGHPIPVAHPVEVLDESYRRAGYYSR